jgi:hypothetical protein
MRARTITKHTPAQRERPTFVLRIDEALWAWIAQAPLVGVRLPPAYVVPPSHIQDADQDAIDLVRFVAGHESAFGKPELQVERGDKTTIGGIVVEAATLDAIEELHPAVTWRHVRRWLAGWTAGGELVAIWWMPEGVTLTAFVVAEFNGQVWACNEHFCVRVIEPGALEQIRQRRPAHAEFVQDLEAKFRAGAAGDPARITINGWTVDIGPISVMSEHFRVIKGIAGAGLDWHTTTPDAPAIGFRAGVPMALIAPLLKPTPPSRRSS